VLQCINGASSNPVEGRTKICQLKGPILTLFGFNFQTYIYIYTIFLLGFGTDSVVFLVFHFNTTTIRFKLQAHLNLISTFLLIRFKIVADVTNNDFSDGSLK
jgi:hypothetical protein